MRSHNNFDNYFTGFVRATNQLWVIGDDLLVSSFHQLLRMRNRYNLDLYINTNYEISAFTVVSRNFVKQIMSGLVKALNSNTYLPTMLLILLSDIIPATEGLALKGDFYLHKIFNSIKEDIHKRTQQLPAKATGMLPVHILVTKALPRPYDNDNMYKSRRRRYNRQMDNIARQYDIEAIHAYGISPNDLECFDGLDLSKIGKIRLWQALSEQVLNMDASFSEAFITRRTERISGTTPAPSQHQREYTHRGRGGNMPHNRGPPHRQVNDNAQYLGIEVTPNNANQIQAFRRAFNRQLMEENPMSFNQMARIWFNNRCGRAAGAYHRERVQQERRIQLHGTAQQRMNQLMQAGDGRVVDRINNRYRTQGPPDEL